MTIVIDLNKTQSDKLRMIYSMVHDPEITCVEDYVEVLLVDLLERIWNDVRNDIMN